MMRDELKEGRRERERDDKGDGMWERRRADAVSILGRNYG